MARCAAFVMTVLAMSSTALGREGGTGEYVDLILGVKVTAGGNIWTAPDNVPPTIDVADVGFSHLRGGAGAGAGIAAEARFVKYVALELAFLYEWDVLYEEIHINTAKYRNTLIAHNVRIPLLVKGVLPLDDVRLAICLGPEFVVPAAASGVTTGQNVPDPPTGPKTKTKTSTMLTMGIDITPELGKHFVLPIGLRASWNGTQPKAYAQRVPGGLTANPPPTTFLVQNSWDFRLQVGLGYEL